MASDPERHVMEKAYAHWTPIDDMLCGSVFVKRPTRGSRGAQRRWAPS